MAGRWGRGAAVDHSQHPGDKQREGEEGKQPFHHSSFLSGSTTIAAGSMLVEQGMLKEITPHSGECNGHVIPGPIMALGGAGRG
jgi:hypothetical protein|eukprot:COSAG01_NODE_6161_length_3816_cov_110.535916_3_plen_84_part_00